MKRLVLILALLALAGCSSPSEEKRRELVNSQVAVIQRQIDQLGRGQKNLESRAERIRSNLALLNHELDESGARLTAARASNGYLHTLVTVGFGPSPGRWLLVNPAFTSRNLLILSFLVLAVWVLYRIYLRNHDRESFAEVDRVLSRLENPPPPARAVLSARESQGLAAVRPEPPPKPAPKARPAPPPAPVPEAEPATAEPATAEPAAEEADATDKPRRITPRKEVRKKVARPQSKKCKVEGCSNKHRSKGYCNKHYQQWRRSGNPEGEKEE